MNDFFGVLTVFLFTSLAPVVASEVGFVLGRRRKSDVDPDGRSRISMVEGALPGLLGLLLGFTSGSSVGRFDLRQDLVVKEANALGTVVLRGDFLQPPVQSEDRAKLREHAELRLEFVQAGLDAEKPVAESGKPGRLQSKLRERARDEARKRPTPIAASLVAARNDLFDPGETRLAALNNTVPAGVRLVLYFVAALTVGSLGYGSDLTGRRLVLSVSFVSALMAVILTLLVDLGYPRHGLIRLSQESMIRVRESLK